MFRKLWLVSFNETQQEGFISKLFLFLMCVGALEAGARVEMPLGIQGVQVPEETSFAKKLSLRLPRDFANQAASFGDLSFNYLNVFFDFYGLKSFCVCGTFLSCTAIFLDPGETLYIRQVGGSGGQIQYSIDTTNWNSASFPILIANNNPAGGNIFVSFLTDVTFSSIHEYFMCGSSGIQFGSASLKSDGTRPKITVNNVTDYPGLIQNGGAVQNGYSNISILNLEVLATGATTLAQFGGWIGQAYFGRGASGCYIVNCSSDGAMGSQSGGIVGIRAGSDGGNLTILGCYSSGSIDDDAGGIAGFEAGVNGEIFVQYSWSSGVIGGLQSGGIFGSAAGFPGTASANDCFSVGTIAGAESGGIFGKFAGAAAVGPATASRCYSRGNIIGGRAGGIFGARAAEFGGGTVADNSYSSGNVAGVDAGGIYGAPATAGGVASQVNTYVANGTWSSVAANAALAGTPSGGSVIGTTWADTALNQPYDFSKFGYTPYSTNNISIAGGVPSLVQSFSQTVTAGSPSRAAMVSGLNYTILQKKKGGVVGAYPTITIKSTTGVISTTARTAAGTYTLTIDNEVPGDSDGYAITEVVLTVKAKSGRPKKSW